MLTSDIPKCAFICNNLPASGALEQATQDNFQI